MTAMIDEHGLACETLGPPHAHHHQTTLTAPSQPNTMACPEARLRAREGGDGWACWRAGGLSLASLAC